MRNFITDLTKTLINQQKKIKSGAVFFTHGLSSKRCGGYGKRAVEALQNSNVFEKVYPKWNSAQVEKMECPFKLGEMEKFEAISQIWLDWIKNKD
jgi:hypothetical protein